MDFQSHIMKPMNIKILLTSTMAITMFFAAFTADIIPSIWKIIWVEFIMKKCQLKTRLDIHVVTYNFVDLGRDVTYLMSLMNFMNEQKKERNQKDPNKKKERVWNVII